MNAVFDWPRHLPLRIRLWLLDRIAGPNPETEADRIRSRSTIPLGFHRRWWRRRR